MAVLTRVSSPSLIGRGDELTELRRVLGEVLAGGSACAVVAGEAGLGKTRLVNELLRGTEDVEVLVGGCVEVGPAVLPYAPFVDILSDLAQRQGTAGVHALGGATGDELSRLLPDEDDAGAPDVTRASASRLYAALRALFTAWPRSGRCCCWSRTCTGPTAPPVTCSACSRGDSRRARSCCSPPGPTRPTRSTPSRCSWRSSPRPGPTGSSCAPSPATSRRCN